MLKLYKVYDGTSFIGWYRAKNETIAMARAQRDEAQQSAGFRKSRPVMVFKNLRAVEAPATPS